MDTTTAPTVTLVSEVEGLLIGTDDDGVPVKLRVGVNRAPSETWCRWLVANFNSHLLRDGKLRRIERWQQP